MALAIDPGRGNPGKIKLVLCGSAVGAVLCLFLEGFFLSPALAQQSLAPTDSAAEMAYQVTDTLVVRAAAMADDMAPTAGGVVTRVLLDDKSGPADLAGELAQVAGIQVRRFGGVGFAAVPALRGASAAQIRVFLDGMPLNNAQTGDLDLSKLPAERLSAIEVHRGVVPAGWGGMGGAGAINLITRDRSEGSDVSVFAGSFGDLGGRVTWGASGDEGRRSILLLAHGRRADNDYKYNDHNQTFNDASDDTTRRRENAWFEEWGLWGNVRQETGDLSARLTGGYFRKDGGRPGPINYPSPHASVRFNRGNGQLHLSWKQGLTLEIAGAVENQYLYDPAGEIDDGFGGTISSRAEDVTGRLSWSGLLWTDQQGGSFFSTLGMVAGVEERRQWYQQWYDADEDPLRNRNTTSAFASATIGLLADRVEIVPAWRWQRNADNFPPVPFPAWRPEETGVSHQQDDVSPSLAAIWQISPERLFLQGHLASAVRVPNWIELFGHRGGIDGNRELQPESIHSSDIAVTWKTPSGNSFGRLAYFNARTDQAIVFIQNSPGTSKAFNIGETSTRGFELEASGIGPARVRFTGSLTLQRAKDEGPDPVYEGNDLPFLSDRVFWMRVSRTWSHWQPWLEFTWQSGMYRDRANTELDRAPARELLNLGLARDWAPSWLGAMGQLTLAGEVVNLFNNTVYDIEEFPLPGRSWQLSARLNW